MPHVIRATSIPLSERRPHLVAYLAQVRRALDDPSLPPRMRARLASQRDRILTELGRS